jgi:hypothetical protein
MLGKGRDGMGGRLEGFAYLSRRVLLLSKPTREGMM